MPSLLKSSLGFGFRVCTGGPQAFLLCRRLTHCVRLLIAARQQNSQHGAAEQYGDSVEDLARTVLGEVSSEANPVECLDSRDIGEDCTGRP